MRKIRVALATFILLFAIACADSPSEPNPTQPVMAVVVEPDTVELSVGATVRLVAKTYDKNGILLTGRGIQWQSSNDNLALVSSDGTAAARAAGTVTVRAISEGKTGAAVLRISNRALARIQIENTPIVLDAGGSRQLSARFFAADGTELFDRTVTWAVLDSTIARFRSANVLEGRAVGLTTLVATADGVTAAAIVTVRSDVVRVEIDPPNAVLTVGEVLQVVGIPWGENNVVLNRPVIWTSSNSDIVTVEAPGRITAHRVGTATIFATSDGRTGEAQITVTNWVRRPLLTINGEAPPVTIHSKIYIDSEGLTRYKQFEVRAGRLKTIASDPTSGRYELTFDVWIYPDTGATTPVTSAQLVYAGMYTRDPANGALVLQAGDWPVLTGQRLSDGRIAINGRLLIEGQLTRELSLVYAAQ